jgi:hypothetical protein
MRRLQARGVVTLGVTISLLGDYREDDDRRRYRIVPAGIGATRTYSGRTLLEAIEVLLTELET